MGRLFAIFLLISGAVGLGGCASSEQQDDPTHVSTIPWNRPERWESQGPLGSMMNSDNH